MSENQHYAIVIGVTWANGLGLIRSLGQVQLPVLALDPNTTAIGFASRYVAQGLVCPEPEKEEAAFIDFMLKLGKTLGKPGVLFLTRDQDLSTVSRHRETLQAYFHLPFASWDVMSRIVDKQGQYAVAERVNLPLPATFFPTNDEDAAQGAAQVPCPVIVKPLYHANFSKHFGAKGFVAHTPDEVLAYYRKGAQAGYRMLIQEVIPGGPERLYTYGSYLNRVGEPLAEFTGRKLRQNPRMFGTCRAGECIPAPQVAELGLRILRALDFWGISQVEFKHDPRDGQFKLIEVNARNYQWQHLATLCGANLAYTAYRDVLGLPVTPVRAEDYGKRWVLAASDLVLTPKEILHRQTALGEWLRSWRGVVADGIFSLRDPRPVVRYVKNQLGRLWKKIS